jgi:hypothetical protein
MKRICVNVTDEHVGELNKRAKDWGVPVAEQIRRALNIVLLGYELAPAPEQLAYAKTVAECKQHAVLVVTKKGE